MKAPPQQLSPAPNRIPVQFLSLEKTQNPAAICEEISGELEDMAKWLLSGNLSPAQLRLLLSTLEKRKLTEHGLRLSSTISIEGVVHFLIRFANTDELCADLHVEPMNGKITTRLPGEKACTGEPTRPHRVRRHLVH